MSDDWPEIEIGYDRISARRFWESVLAFADADRATRIEFIPARGEYRLAVMVDETMFPMDPPPADYDAWLVKVGQELIAGPGCTGAIRLYLLRWFRVPIRGTVPSSRSVWSAFCDPCGLRFKRLSPTHDRP